LQWLPAAITTSFCAFMIVMGRLGDVYGLRKIFYSCMAIFALASLACGLVSTIEQLIFFRFVQGISAACVSLGPALVTHNFSKSQQAKVMGVFSGLAGSGLAVGPVLGGFIVDYLDWHWIFFIIVPFVAIGLTLSLLYVNENKGAEDKGTVDWLGAALLITAVMSLVITTMQGEVWGWNSPHVLIGYVVFIVAFIIFVVVGRQSKHPILPFKLLWNRTFVPCAVTCVVVGLFMGVLTFFNPLYLQIVLEKSATTSGWLLFFISATFLVTTPIAGAATHHFGVKPGTVMVSFSLIFAAVFHALFTVEGNLLFIILGFILFGIGWAAVNVSPTVAAIHKAGQENAGIVMGGLWAFFNLSAALGLAIMGILFRIWEERDILQRFADKSVQLTQDNLALISQFVDDPESGAESGIRFL
jgi:MFS family permease